VLARSRHSQEDIGTVQIAVVSAAEIGYNSYRSSSLGPVAAGAVDNLSRRTTERTQRLRRPNGPDATREAERTQELLG
jgi:hypothetical protein